VRAAQDSRLPAGHGRDTGAATAWVAELVRRSTEPITATAEDMDRWIEYTTALPSGTPVVIAPPRGPVWRGVVAEWTQPGTGALMVWIVPGVDAPVLPGNGRTWVLVAARFVSPTG
jgi:hypothetical protein